MKPNLIILDGVDCTGKTTLAGLIAEKLIAVQLKCTASPAMFQGLHDYHMNMLHNAKLNLDLGQRVVMDRFWMSEVCYGPVMGRPEYDSSSICRELVKLDRVYVFTDTSKAGEDYANGMDDFDPAHHLTPLQFRQIRSNYYNVFESERNISRVENYDYTKQGSGEQLEAFIESLLS